MQKKYKYFKTIVKYGHQGAGKSYETARYIEASSLIDAMNIACSLGGIKRQQGFRAIPLIREITPQEYMESISNNNALHKKLRNIGDEYLAYKLVAGSKQQ